MQKTAVFRFMSRAAVLICALVMIVSCNPLGGGEAVADLVFDEGEFVVGDQVTARDISSGSVTSVAMFLNNTRFYSGLPGGSAPVTLLTPGPNTFRVDAWLWDGTMVSGTKTVEVDLDVPKVTILGYSTAAPQRSAVMDLTWNGQMDYVYLNGDIAMGAVLQNGGTFRHKPFHEADSDMVRMSFLDNPAFWSPLNSFYFQLPSTGNLYYVVNQMGDGGAISLDSSVPISALTLHNIHAVNFWDEYQDEIYTMYYDGGYQYRVFYRATSSGAWSSVMLGGLPTAMYSNADLVKTPGGRSYLYNRVSSAGTTTWYFRLPAPDGTVQDVYSVSGTGTSQLKWPWLTFRSGSVLTVHNLGSFSNVTTTTLTVNAPDLASPVSPGDFNKDGLLDVLYSENGSLMLYVQAHDGSFRGSGVHEYAGSGDYLYGVQPIPTTTGIDVIAQQSNGTSYEVKHIDFFP